MKPLLLLPGEPAGIGPDVLIEQLARSPATDLIPVADCQLLNQRAQQLGKPLRFSPIKAADLSPGLAVPDGIPVIDIKTCAPVTAGKLNEANSAYVMQCLDTAIELCLKAQAAGMVTGAIHKGIIIDAGFQFTGHTEYLAARSQVDQVVMMLASEQMRVALVTTHLPLSAVSASITHDKLLRVIRLLQRSLQRDFGCAEPHILVAGLNPHAGEGGHLGREEAEIISPALAELRAEGLRLTGPLPADTLFQPTYLQQADAVVAMYHDQGLPVLKYQSFGRAVNITLGLPFIRTSVDHGTAIDIAGTGRADAGSMQVAVDTALAMARQQGH